MNLTVIGGLLENIFEEGLIYGIMAVGVYITYSILDFPDLTVDGSFPLGSCIAAAMIGAGAHPLLACLVALLCGMAAGCITGVLHVKCKITDLLSGILTMTALWSVNLVITAGKAVLPFYDMPTIFNSGLAALKGGYVLEDAEGTPDVLLIGTGSEVELCVKAKALLAEKNVKARVVSMPCIEEFEKQTAEYKESVLPSAVKARVCVEAGSPYSWYKYCLLYTSRCV